MQVDRAFTDAYSFRDVIDAGFLEAIVRENIAGRASRIPPAMRRVAGAESRSRDARAVPHRAVPGLWTVPGRGAARAHRATSGRSGLAARLGGSARQSAPSRPGSLPD